MSAPKLLQRNQQSVAAITAGRWLRSLDDNWPSAVCRCLEREFSVVRVLVAQMRGSVPREPGACMLVTQADVEGTIGGGRLEWQASQAARDLLADTSAPAVRMQRLVLGTELGQCCGGVVELWLERFTRADVPLLRRAARAVHEGASALIATRLQGTTVTRRLCRADTHPLTNDGKALLASKAHRVQLLKSADHDTTLVERLDVTESSLWIYGAGHVGQALVRAFSELPFRVTWIDSRAELLPADLPDNVHALHAHEPVETVSDAPPGTHYLVLTHDHALDYALCRAILERGDFAWAGLIGSSSKSARFRSRLARDQVAADVIARLVCPIGVAGIGSKRPAAIAIGVAAQLLQQLGSVRAAQDMHDTKSKAPAPDCDCSSENCASCPSTRRAQP
jgi:xanthine dehydrogenase accessory factor